MSGLSRREALAGAAAGATAAALTGQRGGGAIAVGRPVLGASTWSWSAPAWPD